MIHHDCSLTEVADPTHYFLPIYHWLFALLPRRQGRKLRSAGAHFKRATEAAKDGEYDDAVMDLFRALGEYPT
jgi:hypothetical protein